MTMVRYQLMTCLRIARGSRKARWSSVSQYYSLLTRADNYLWITTLFHEARGIDAGPRLLAKMRSFQDPKTEECLKIILRDEEKHVAVGIKW